MRANKEIVFLASKEHRGDWSRVRQAFLRGEITDSEGRLYLWIQVDPPVIGQPYGLGQENIGDLLLRPHFEGDSLFPISKFPTAVFIYRVIDNSLSVNKNLSTKTLELAAWGEIYETREHAEASMRVDS